jgi:tRNA(fMet)-specific endonuclease VapC
VILDTNALSALLDKDAALLEAIRQSRELALPVIVLGEFRFGIDVSRRRDQYETCLRRRSLPVSCASDSGRDLRLLRGN